VVSLLAEARADRVRPDVAARGREVLVVVDQLGVETLLVEVADTAVASVELLRIDPVEPFHRPGESVAVALDDRVEVVRHQAVGPDLERLACDHAAKESDEEPVVLTVPVDNAPVHPADRHVEGTVGRKRVARQSRHRAGT
jgi:hypothetical protein